MMSKLYKRIPVEEGALTECVGVHVIKWRPEWGKPTYAFVKADEDELQARIPQWISVKDRLPENSNIVLVCVDNIVSAGYVQIGWMLGEFFENKHVTHWMPFPEPPKENER